MNFPGSTSSRRPSSHRMGRAMRGMLVTLLATLACAGPASAALFEDADARRAILDLRTRIQEMRSSIDLLRNSAGENQRELSNRLERIDRLEPALRERIESSTGNIGRTQLELGNQIEGLRQDLARLRGQIETLVNDMENSQKRQKDFYVDLDTRLRKIEQPPEKAAAPAPPPPIAVALPDENQRLMFEAAMTKFRNSEFRDAVTAFDAFLRQYPGSTLAPSAQYWMGTSLYAQRDYKLAIAAQQVLLKNWPDSPRAPEALFNIASSQIDLKDPSGARTTLEGIITRYPGTPAARMAADRLATLK